MDNKYETYIYVNRILFGTSVHRKKENSTHNIVNVALRHMFQLTTILYVTSEGRLVDRQG